MGGSRETIGDRFKAASPVTYIDKDDPPILTFHGTADDVVPFDQAEVLHAALEKAGTPNQLVTIKGEGHGFRAPEALTNTLKQTQDFFAKHLKPAK